MTESSDPTTETTRMESDEKRIRGYNVLEAQRVRFEMEGAINNGQWSQEAKTGNCPLHCVEEHHRQEVDLMRR